MKYSKNSHTVSGGLENNGTVNVQLQVSMFVYTV